MSPSPLLRGIAQHIDFPERPLRTQLLAMASAMEDVIALGRGDPDFHTPAHIVAAAHRALDDDRHHYTESAGLAALRQAIARMLAQDYRLAYAPEEIIVTHGVEEAIMICMAGLLNPGDEVLMGHPRFTNYDKAINLCHARVRSVPTREENDFVLQPEDVEARITPRTRLLVLVSPDNPTGAVTPPATVEALADVVRRRDLLLLSDEIYSRILYDDARHLSPASLPGLRERTITLNGFSKAYAMTGWRIGYMAGPADFMRRMDEVRHAFSISTHTVSQYAALAALTGGRAFWEPIRERLRARRALLMAAFDDMGFTYGFPGGSYFIFPNIACLGVAADAFCLALLREGRVLAFPGSQSGDLAGEYIRVSYLQPRARLREAVARMRRVIASL